MSLDSQIHSPPHFPFSAAPVSELQPRVSPIVNFHNSETQDFRVRVSTDLNVDLFDDLNNRTEKFPVSDTKSKSLLSEFDDYVAGKTNNDLGHGFEIGDMVWGKVKSHPWWPGHIYNEAFASPSVRRTKREGHLLVAFFGDSSYGWFEPDELIHFDSNFVEKSQQTSSRTFLKAVEEAVDEASRRRAIALVCKCRNVDNFRPTNVKGYLSVEVPDYEPGGFYSDSEIRKARNSFRPSEALAFAKQLALAPHDVEHESIEFINNKATAYAYRKAVFEQYDETYEQAFGLKPSPSPPQSNTIQQPSRAPLSGPIVTGEALNGRKNLAKSVKVKDSMKKGRHLFNQRDDPSNTFQVACRDKTPDTNGHYVLPKKTPVVPVVLHNFETGFSSHNSAISTPDAKAALMDGIEPDGSGLASKAISSDVKPHLDNEKESPQEMTQSLEQDDGSSKSLGRSNLSWEVSLLSTVDQNAKQSGPDFKLKEQGCLAVVNGGNDMRQVKIKGHKRPADELNSKTSATGERKKKKDINLQPTSGHLEKHSTSGKRVHLSGKPVSTVMAPRADIRAEQVQGEVISRNLLAMDTIGDVNFELPQLLDDLQALALDPFHGLEKKAHAGNWKFFLYFRSRVYQKSLPSSPVTVNHAPEACVTKSPLSVRASDSPDNHVKALPVVKPVKHIVRPDDPTKAGKKRAPSDRQEEIAAKRMKKIKDLKALAAEKAAISQKTSEANQKTYEARKGEGKESMLLAPPKLVKPDLNRKVQRPAKVVEPTMLVIKFPPQTSLPSAAELKARFARFGPMDQSGLRVFWTTSTCRVVFLYRADAVAAYKYFVANPSLFGNAGVRYFLRESGDSTPAVSVAANARNDNGAANEPPGLKDPAAVHHLTSVPSGQPLPQSTVQLKSCLKKPTGDESDQPTSNGGSSKGNQRVKFVLGGEESSKGEPLLVGSRNNNASFAGGAPSIAMDFNSKNFQVVTSQPPLLPTPPATTMITNTPQHNLLNSEMAMAPRKSPKYINTTTMVASTTVDISRHMLTLLTRCNDVVNNLAGLLGYVPYHSL